ncbi:MAG: M15 family metallopeptidase [Lachnospiraceae bacterium]|nr:M15 family metallopeptidase [Lachnospiraceae bacterium]
MEQIRSMEEEKKERQKNILLSLNLDECGYSKRGGTSSGPGHAIHHRKTSGGHKKDEKTKCIILGAAALILAAAAIFQECRGDSGMISAVQNRIRMAGEDRQNLIPEYTEYENSGNLILVNKDYGLPSDYSVELHWLNNGQQAVAEEIYDALSAMLTDGSAEGREFVVASGYRSHETQQRLLEEDVQASMKKYGLTWQEAYDRESRETMPEGHSEHETGLTVDLVALDYQMLDGAQEYTEENQWLRQHCQDYGFILRYPRGKEEITGISYEPWHFRYVGTEAAKEIMEKGITLEEYLVDQT